MTEVRRSLFMRRFALWQEVKLIEFGYLGSLQCHSDMTGVHRIKDTREDTYSSHQVVTLHNNASDENSLGKRNAHAPVLLDNSRRRHKRDTEIFPRPFLCRGRSQFEQPALHSPYIYFTAHGKLLALDADATSPTVTNKLIARATVCVPLGALELQ